VVNALPYLRHSSRAQRPNSECWVRDGHWSCAVTPGSDPDLIARIPDDVCHAIFDQLLSLLDKPFRKSGREGGLPLHLHN
jgi:hypothetical protein